MRRYSNQPCVLEEGSLYAHLRRLHETGANTPRLFRKDETTMAHQDRPQTLYEVLKAREEEARFHEILGGVRRK